MPRHPSSLKLELLAAVTDSRSIDCLALGAMCPVCMALQRQRQKGMI